MLPSAAVIVASVDLPAVPSRAALRGLGVDDGHGPEPGDGVAGEQPAPCCAGAGGDLGQRRAKDGGVRVDGDAEGGTRGWDVGGSRVDVLDLHGDEVHGPPFVFAEQGHGEAVAGAVGGEPDPVLRTPGLR